MVVWLESVKEEPVAAVRPLSVDGTGRGCTASVVITLESSRAADSA